MIDILYVEINDEVEEKVIEHFGSWVREYQGIQRGDGCYAIAAIHDDKVVGCAAIHPAQFIPPLDKYFDAFIELIEVDECYRRQGIGKHMIGILEEKAREFGYKQIRAWSSEDKVEALNMWYSLNYCMRPAAMLGQSIKLGFENQQIIGYYYAKILN
ncbi:MAG: GNAT family N-acetyltransferase [Lachnospiraceae bacterium]|nr:GNAT family N-acetyltransferase [Lachnospiraceae bacterium]